jgi:hypothetical protein
MNSEYQFNLVNLQYARSLENYKIIETTIKNGKCIVFFSGNGLYFPNTYAELQKTISSDRYEWEKLYSKHYEKIIFIRDVYKQWYVEGISDVINSIDKLNLFLDKEIEGFSSTFIGSSAGGYAAVLLGDLCNADLIISLSGQFDLIDEKKRQKANQILYKSKDERYLKLDDLKSKNIVYFYPRYSTYDEPQFKFIRKNKNITIIQMKSSFHGVPFYPYALKKVLNLNLADFKKLSCTQHHMFLFSLKYSTWADFFNWTLIKLKKIYFKLILLKSKGKGIL